MTTTTAPAQPLPTITAITPTGPIDMICEPVSDDFAITPAITGPRNSDTINAFAGAFSITHRHTGYAIPGPQACINCARHAAHALARIGGIDWSTLDRDNAKPFIDSLRPDYAVELRDALAVMALCRQSACPNPGLD